MSQRILIVDDDRFLVQGVTTLLQREGYTVDAAPDFESAVRMLRDSHPHLMILDLGLPDGDGVSLCRRMRNGASFPILMVTSRSSSTDKVAGLDSGADDYLVKPFEGVELLARVRSLLRRSGMSNGRAKPESLQIANLTLDLLARKVLVGQHHLTLTEKEFQLLTYLVEHAGTAVARDRAFSSVWGYNIEFASNTLEVTVYRLRKKLEEAGAVASVETIRGYGYRLTA
ncbi:MAG: response regulator transcription factor [Fimbriimonadaceae bacterium]